MWKILFQWILLTNSSGSGALDASYLCFNPCFSGSCSRILVSISQTIIISQFQSLFQWILLTNKTIQIATIKRRFMFQSLFQWILLTNTSARVQVFFVGSFQSLFQWILLTNSLDCCNAGVPEVRFNPCFSGSCSRIPPGKTQKRIFIPVSILVLVDLAHEQYEPEGYIPHNIPQFQSLFQWILLTNRGDIMRCWFAKSVSILVLVDLAHELGVGAMICGKIFPVSILVLVDLAHEQALTSVVHC